MRRYNIRVLLRKGNPGGARAMIVRTTSRSAVLLLFLAVQFLWLTTAIAYSDTIRGIRPITPPPPPNTDIAVVSPSSVSSGELQIPQEIGGSLEPIVLDPSFDRNIGSGPSSSSGDLGADIKYCIVFPILNNASSPIPAFNVPLCPSDTPDDAPRLTVVKKVVNDNGGFATTSDFGLFVDSLRVFSGVIGVFSPGSYTVSEATTSVALGTTTLHYSQTFSGDCDDVGNITLARGDVKTCTITNDDPGDSGDPGDPGGNGNGGDGGDGGNGGNGDGGGNGGGGGSSSRAGSSSGSGSPPGQVLGAAVPGVPNTGMGGSWQGTLGTLIFAFSLTAIGYVVLVYCTRLREEGLSLSVRRF